MFDITTYGLVSVIMPHTGKLIDNATYGSVWLILQHTGQFE